MINATGSMANKIGKLKRSMRAMAEQITQLPGQPDIAAGALLSEATLSTARQGAG